MKLVISGRVQCSGKVPFERGLLAAYALVAGEEVAKAAVDDNGEYTLEIEAGAAIPAVELWIAPAFVERAEAGTLAQRKTIGSGRFAPDKTQPGVFRVSEIVSLPADLLRRLLRRVVEYHIHGTVYAQYETYFAHLGGARIDFYEVDHARELEGGLPMPPLRVVNQFLGRTYTRSDGSYDFKFKFPSPVKPKPGSVPGFGKPGSLVETAPDVRARIFLYVNGVWTKVHEVPMTDADWNIGTDFHRDYLVPSAATSGLPEVEDKPETGFRFNSIGLFPVDHTRIQGGYATARSGDPARIAGVRHAPFCNTLRVLGLFAGAPAVTTYEVHYQRVDADGSAIGTEGWQPLPDSLSNLQWNETTHSWDTITLGPTDGRFRNIDVELEAHWLEHALKFTWNTRNVVDGYYLVRVRGYDASNTMVVEEQMPMLRIDNTVPQASLDVSAPATTKCGDLNLGADRIMSFRVTAYQENGHLLNYWISGCRGRYPESAGANVTVSRPDADALWYGNAGVLHDFTVAARSSVTEDCSTMAYSFRLYVQGSATDGYDAVLSSQHAEVGTLLVVSE